jgi:alpha,alpha-trehalase
MSRECDVTEVDLPPLAEAGPQARDYRPIGDYALVGDCHGAALVARDGSIDWCCFERFDSEPIFSRLLDRSKGGWFQIRPEAAARVHRRYRPETNVLETTFETQDGTVQLVDFMAMDPARNEGEEGEGGGRLVRIVWGVSGQVALKAVYRPQRGFKPEPLTLSVEDGFSLAEDEVVLAADVDLALEDGVVVAAFALEAGEARRFAMAPSRDEARAALDAADRLRETTEEFWRDWSRYTSYSGRYRDAVVRSALMLKALTYAPTGAIVAAPTTSLPEWIGGIRNWDYRYCWLRDACFALYALKKLGHLREAAAFSRFTVEVSRETLPKLLPLYGIEGETDLDEWEVEHFEGYRGSAPVRAGNEAVEQHQLDVYGQILDLIDIHVRLGGEVEPGMREVATAFADYVAEHWRDADAGLWEPRLDPRRHVHSAIMAWVALDRAIRLFGDRPHWCEARDALVADIRENGVHANGYLTQVFGEDAVDAAVLVAPMVDLPIDDEVLARTVDEVKSCLGHGPLVHRYRNEDGLPGDEGTFLVCAFWLVDALIALGRVDEARERFEQLLELGNDVGLYSEEMAEDGTFLGNFPQAFTHLGLLHSALVLDLVEHCGVEAVRGTYADRAVRETSTRTLEPISRG